jgi:hypothetical protein
MTPTGKASLKFFNVKPSTLSSSLSLERGIFQLEASCHLVQ